MNNGKYNTVLWSMFKLERNSGGTYECEFSIDDSWVERQQNKIETALKPTLFIIPDRFCELAYELELPRKQMLSFCRKIRNKLKVDCILESKALDLFWNKNEFRAAYEIGLQEIYPTSILEQEKKKRSVLYNLNNYPIDNTLLEKYARRALAAFNAERQLEEKII